MKDTIITVGFWANKITFTRRSGKRKEYFNFTLSSLKRAKRAMYNALNIRRK